MITLSKTDADAFACQWAAAWNSHDPQRISCHYRDDVVYYSPFAAPLGAGTPFSGRAALSRYISGALERYPDLHFGPDLLVAAGAGSIAIAYRSVEDLIAIETLELDDNRRVSTARCHYRQAPTGQSAMSPQFLTPPNHSPDRGK
jgi:SnoaL-like domain